MLKGLRLVKLWRRPLLDEVNGVIYNPLKKVLIKVPIGNGLKALLSLLKIKHEKFKPGTPIEHIINVLTKEFVNLLLVSLLGPLLLQPVQTLEVQGLAAHRASGFGTLVVPLLDTAKAEAVPAGEVAVGSLAVAHGALHRS